MNTHRASWEIHFGPVPDGLCVLHKCDVPQCVNPAHLWLGTKKDNIHDAMRKSRYRNGVSRGEKHGRAKLREADVRSILADSRTHREIALAYNISRSSVAMIKTRRNWSWL